MPIRPVKVGDTRVDNRGRLVIPSELRNVLGLAANEHLDIFRLEGALDIFGEALYVGVPASRERGLLLISYAPVKMDQVMSTMEAWANNYVQIRSRLNSYTARKSQEQNSAKQNEQSRS